MRKYCFIAIVFLSATVYTQTRIDSRQTDENLAPTLLNNALANTAPNGIDYNNTGVKKALNDRHEEAVKDFRRAIELAPECRECRYNLGRSLIKAGNPDEAVEVLKKLVGDKKDFADAWSALGDALSEKGHFEDGVAAYETALKVGPADAVTLSNLGHSLAQVKRHDEAMIVLDKAISLDPGLATAHSNRGVALFSKGRTKEAVESFRKAYSLDPRSAEICNNLGVALDKLGKKEAHTYFETAVRLRPDWGFAIYNLGMSNLKRGERDTARSQLSSLEKLDLTLADKLRKELLGKFIVEVPKQAGNSLRD